MRRARPVLGLQPNCHHASITSAASPTSVPVCPGQAARVRAVVYIPPRAISAQAMRALLLQRHRRDVDVAARQQSTEPGVAAHGPAFAPSDHSPGAVDHQPTNVPVAPLRDPAQALLAAA